MNSAGSTSPAHDAPELLWSTPLPTGGGGSIIAIAGGCLVTGPTWIIALTADGRPGWTAAAQGSIFGEPVLLDEAVARIEGDAVVVRDLGTGEVTGRWAAPASSTLAVTPWGDLLYSQVDDTFAATVQCVSRTGVHRWQVTLDNVDVVVNAPFAMADVVVIARLGALWAYDETGRAVWVAGLNGIRAPTGDDQRPRPEQERLELSADPLMLDTDRVVAELRWYEGRRIVQMDGRARRMTTVVDDPRMGAPYAVLHGASTGWRLAGSRGQVEIGHMRREFPVVVVEPGGATVWQDALPAAPVHLTPVPDGGLVVTCSPSVTRWHDYHKWYDLRAETFVRCLNADGAHRGTWYAPGPITHLPVARRDGVVHVGSHGQLVALAVSEGSR